MQIARGDQRPTRPILYPCLGEQSDSQGVRALFRLQRVNKTFQDTILKSRACRQAMFLEYMDDVEYMDDDGGQNWSSKTRLNPLIPKLSPLRIHTELRGPYLSYWTLPCRRHHYLSGYNLLPLQLLNALKTDTGSWRQTLVSSTPVDIQLRFEVRIINGEEIQHTYTIREGATLGGVMHWFVYVLQAVAKGIGLVDWERTMNMLPTDLTRIPIKSITRDGIHEWWKKVIKSRRSHVMDYFHARPHCQFERDK